MPLPSDDSCSAAQFVVASRLCFERSFRADNSACVAVQNLHMHTFFKGSTSSVHGSYARHHASARAALGAIPVTACARAHSQRNRDAAQQQQPGLCINTERRHKTSRCSCLHRAQARTAAAANRAHARACAHAACPPARALSSAEACRSSCSAGSAPCRSSQRTACAWPAPAAAASAVSPPTPLRASTSMPCSAPPVVRGDKGLGLPVLLSSALRKPSGLQAILPADAPDCMQQGRYMPIPCRKTGHFWRIRLCCYNGKTALPVLL